MTLIGQPTASAEPVTADMLEAYKTWLDMERRMLSWDMADDPSIFHRYCGMGASEDRRSRFKRIDRTFSFAGRSGLYHGEAPSPYTRAALVLSTVGCDWRRAGR